MKNQESDFEKFFNNHAENMKREARRAIESIGPKAAIEIALEIARDNEASARRQHVRAKAALDESNKLLKESTNEK